MNTARLQDIKCPFEKNLPNPFHFSNWGHVINQKEIGKPSQASQVQVF